MTHASSPRRRRMLGALAGAGTLGALGALGPTTAVAADARPVRLVLPNATGSGVDGIARAAQEALSRALGAPVVVENQPGAGGIVGLQTLARAPADGLTLSIVSNNVVIFPSLYKSLPFAMPGDFTPIAVIGFTPVVLVVNPKVPAANAKELVALLKAKPGEINYGSSGNGTILHLAAEVFLDEAKVTARHVPYKGVGPMLTDLIGGQVEFVTSSLPSVQSFLKSGQLRAIGVATKERVPAAPDLPTFAEQGLPGYVVEAWFALLGPKGLSAADVKKAHDAVSTAFSAPEVKEAMARQGNIIGVSSPEAAQKFFPAELQKYAAIVKRIGIEAQ